MTTEPEVITKNIYIPYKVLDTKVINSTTWAVPEGFWVTRCTDSMTIPEARRFVAGARWLHQVIVNVGRVPYAVPSITGKQLHYFGDMEWQKQVVNMYDMLYNLLVELD